MRPKLSRIAKRIVVAVPAVLIALQIYYVREMIAALMIFSVLFVGLSIAVLFVWLFDWVGEQIIGYAEAGIVWLGHSVMNMIEQAAHRPVWHAVPHFSRNLKQDHTK